MKSRGVGLAGAVIYYTSVWLTGHMLESPHSPVVSQVPALLVFGGILHTRPHMRGLGTGMSWQIRRSPENPWKWGSRIKQGRVEVEFEHQACGPTPEGEEQMGRRGMGQWSPFPLCASQPRLSQGNMRFALLSNCLIKPTGLFIKSLNK